MTFKNFIDFISNKIPVFEKKKNGKTDRIDFFFLICKLDYLNQKNFLNIN